MPIGGFVVSFLPDKAHEVIGSLRDIRGCEVHEAIEEKADSAVVVLEAKTSGDIEDMVEGIKAIDGVLSVDLAYLNIEDEIKENKNELQKLKRA